MMYLKTLLMAAAAVAMGSAGAKADLLLTNNAGQSVQYTLYDGSGQPIAGATGCMRQSGQMFFTGTAYARGQGLYIRGILKGRSDCTGNNVSDTGRGSRQLMQDSSNRRTFISWQNRLTLQ